jgi:hypothetical protein
MGDVLHRKRVFGFQDFTTDPRSGRPQPHVSWLGERLVTWTAWASAVIFLAGAAAYYLKWHETDGPAQMTLAAVLFSAMAIWRQNLLARRRAAYLDAVAAYEAMLKNSAD